MKSACPLFVPLLLAVLAPASMIAEQAALESSPSAFVRAQAQGRVAWHPWTASALAAARESGRSVYVFIGSPLSELARETVSQTFANEKTAAWLNENFFCLFVDADAQPEVLSLGQHYLQSVKQVRGQPVHLWLTPDGLLPYEGANYLPPSEEWGKPGFLNTARVALETWTADPERARALAAEALDLMRVPPIDMAAAPNLEACLESAEVAWLRAVDIQHGGFGGAPKQPEPEVIRFLLRRGSDAARGAAIQAARAMATGGLRDPLDGGFYRRCIDEAWKEPYLQKTLLDQARIALALFEAADAAGDPSLRVTGVRALEFARAAFRRPDGAFAGALDGTLRIAEAGQRPSFASVGTARVATLAMLIEALHRSGEAALSAEALRLAEMLVQDRSRPVGTLRLVPGDSASDLIALAQVLRLKGDAVGATHLFEEANRLYFDKSSGLYSAVPEVLPIGFSMRVPQIAEPMLAEVLALRAGIEAEASERIRRGLIERVRFEELPSGEVLLGLCRTP